LYRAAVEQRTTIHYENEFPSPAGIITLDVSITPVLDSNGTCTHILWSARDITERKQTEEALQDAEARYRLLFEQSPYGVVLLDMGTGQTMETNEVACKQLGYTREEFMTLRISDYEVIEKPKETARHLKKIMTEGSDDFETLHRTKSGAIKNIHVWSKAIRLDKNTLVYAIYQDITERKQAEQQYKNILETAIDGFWTVDNRGRLLEANDAYARMSGYSRNELKGMTISELEAVEKPDEIEKNIAKVIELGSSRFITKHRRKNGTIFDVEVSAQYSNAQGGIFVSFLQDITERKRAEQEIKASLHEKEILLKEIHHRVKNNLQIVSSLLDLQSDLVSDEKMKDVFRGTQNRVHSMALVHEQLYQSSDLASINFAEYMSKLLQSTKASFGIMTDHITITTDINPVLLSIDSALPCGLIVSELISNSIKYAFPKNNKGTINISLTQGTDKKLTLRVQDNGIGMNDVGTQEHRKSLGLTIVETLCKQLRGVMNVDGTNGMTTTIVFSEGAK
jgi:PAS domain S-box-containing protein